MLFENSAKETEGQDGQQEVRSIEHNCPDTLCALVLQEGQIQGDLATLPMHTPWPVLPAASQSSASWSFQLGWPTPLPSNAAAPLRPQPPCIPRALPGLITFLSPSFHLLY